MPSYQVPSLAHRAPVTTRQAPPKESLFLKMLQRLPPEIIAEIHKNFTWLECWKIYRVCRWFRDNFHPNRLPDDKKIEGLLDAERFYKRYDNPSANLRNSTKGPPWFACYHCFTIKGFEHFERFKWKISTREAADSDSEDEEKQKNVQREYSTPPTGQQQQQQQQHHTGQPSSVPPTGNPYYDPTLTGSIMAARRASRERASRESSQDLQRADETFGIRRFCIPCGLRKRYYRPGDVIEYHNAPERGAAAWVCRCWKLRWLSDLDIKCGDCGDLVSLSGPARRRPAAVPPP